MGLLSYLLQPLKSTKSTLAMGSLLGLFVITVFGCVTRDRELLLTLIPIYTMVFVHYFKKETPEVINRPEDFAENAAQEIAKDILNTNPGQEIKEAVQKNGEA